MTIRRLTNEEKAADLAKRGGSMPDFLGSPCHCGWALTEVDETRRECEWCGCVYERKDGFWAVATICQE